ncbi:MAG: histidinol dehydrogenase [bacterium]|nr:histidinol dehydrogenase [bacterium]
MAHASTQHREFLKAPSHAAQRPDVSGAAQQVIADVRERNIAAVRHWSNEFDRWNPPDFRIPDTTIHRAQAETSPELLQQIDFALRQIRGFAAAQKECIKPLSYKPSAGVELGHKIVPLGSVGCYVPGGVYPLIASALMTIATAKVAGVSRVVACAPGKPQYNGIHPTQLAAMSRAGADEIYAVGGIQALAAMAFGADGFGHPVDLICGAGNAYVAEAKRQLFGTVGIDLLAGPTEILVVADDTADSTLLAYDLLGQAEHGVDSPAILITLSREIGKQTIAKTEELLANDYPTAKVAGQSWRDFGTVVYCDSHEAAATLCDEMAPEHLEVHARELHWWHNRLKNYGSIFLGRHATVAYGDKAIGTNHVLPTRGAARYTSGLWVGSFLKTPSYQIVDNAAASVPIAEATAAISDAEGMFGHGLTATIRIADTHNQHNGPSQHNGPDKPPHQQTSQQQMPQRTEQSNDANHRPNNR